MPASGSPKERGNAARAVERSNSPGREPLDLIPMRTAILSSVTATICADPVVSAAQTAARVLSGATWSSKGLPSEWRQSWSVMANEVSCFSSGSQEPSWGM